LPSFPACTRKTRNAYKILVIKYTRKRSFGRLKAYDEEKKNINNGFWGGSLWNALVQVRDYW
jgi:hypothetical protein